MLAAEELGLAQRCLEMTVAYLKERRQFARPIGFFQALKRRRSGKRGRSRYAGGCLPDGDPECVQRPGGIGFTWEHPAHLYLRRAEASSVLCGTPGAHCAALAALVGLPGPGA